ncbi:MAG TPA: cupredoxin domain-containing protein [Gemmatimonadales bacterium]|nr:cupredoxin domain-containing protein [Gemmatimonadales bacterium]
MTSLQIGVTLLGIAAIAWVNWYFFLAARRPVVAASRGSGPQSVRIVVEGGYTPSVVTVEAGRPVRLEFERRETSGCTEEVVVPDFGIRTFLPAHQVTPVQFTPVRPGTYEFTCGMGMVRGRLVARAADGGTAR